MTDVSDLFGCGGAALRRSPPNPHRHEGIRPPRATGAFRDVFLFS